MSTIKFKRLFFDIETSFNIVSSWSVGPKINLSPDNIIHERAIITICYKWEHESRVHSLTWNKGNDKKMLLEFAKIMHSADEVLGHNGDAFDIRWVRTRCIYHGIPLFPDFQSVDTLKLSRRGFKFNSNKLNYIAQFLGIGKKAETGGLQLWKDIVLKNSTSAMKKMVDYCKKDVLLLEKVYQKLSPYIIHKTHIGVVLGKSKHSCPGCGGTHTISNGQRIMSSGLKKQRLHCQDCGSYFTITINKNIDI